MRKEIGNIFDLRKAGKWICISTNATVSRTEKAAFTSGTARQALQRVGRGGLKEELGRAILEKGNHLHEFRCVPRLLAFPTRYFKVGDGEIQVIERSARELMAWLDQHPEVREVYLPKPGCGTGYLQWVEVEERLKGILDDRVIIVDWTERPEEAAENYA
jgi:hypothetical protein